MLKVDLTLEDDQIDNTISRPQTTPTLNNLKTGFSRPSTPNSESFTNSKPAAVNLQSSFKQLISSNPNTKPKSLFAASGGNFGKKNRFESESEQDLKIPLKIVSEEYNICTIDDKLLVDYYILLL